MCAMMEKFRMFFSFIAVAPVCCRQGGAARQMARPGVLPSGKTLPQGEFISPEDVQSKGFPQGLQPLWENDLPWLKGSPKSQRLLGERKGSGVSELWLLSLSEGYGTCLDERDDGEISEILISCRAGNSLFFGAVEYLRHALHEAGVEGRERFILHRGERAVLFGKLRERGGVGDVVRAHLRIHRAGLVGRGI